MTLWSLAILVLVLQVQISRPPSRLLDEPRRSVAHRIVEGRLVDESGRPLKNRRLVIAAGDFHYTSNPWFSPPRLHVITDGAGRFLMDLHGRGPFRPELTHFSLQLEDDLSQIREFKADMLPHPWERQDCGDIVIPDLMQLAEGRVVDENGEGVAGAWGQVSRREVVEGRERIVYSKTQCTDVDGFFRIVDRIPEGPLRLEFGARDMAREIRTIHSGETNLVITLKPPVPTEIRVRVLWEPDRSISLVRILAEGEVEGPTEYRRQANDRSPSFNEFTMRLWPGWQCLYIRYKDATSETLTVLQSIDLVSGVPLDLGDIRLEDLDSFLDFE